MMRDLSMFDPLPDAEKQRKPRPISRKRFVRQAVEKSRDRMREVFEHPAYSENRAVANFLIFETPNMPADEIIANFLIAL